MRNKEKIGATIQRVRLDEAGLHSASGSSLSMEVTLPRMCAFISGSLGTQFSHHLWELGLVICKVLAIGASCFSLFL